MAAISREEVDVNDIKRFILNYEADNAARLEALRQEDAAKMSGQSGQSYSGSGDDILVINAKGVKGLEYKMAGCCNPVYGDDVFGFVTRTQGITIHRTDCPNADRLWEKYPYRCQSVVWADSPSGGSFQAALRIEAALDHSVLGKIMDVISGFKA